MWLGDGSSADGRRSVSPARGREDWLAIRPAAARNTAGAQASVRTAWRRTWLSDPLGFDIFTGYVNDPLPQLAEMHAQGVLTDAEYESAKAIAVQA